MILRAIHDSSRWMPRPGETVFEYWASFSPAAPLFGVAWRFADPAPEAAGAAPAGAARKAAVVEAAVEVAEAPAAVRAGPVEIGVVEVEIVADAVETAGRSAAGLAESLAALAPDEADDLTRIKGIGPKLAAELNRLGVFSIAQVAALTPEDLARIDEGLTAFRGRYLRDDWVGQAKALLGA